MKNYVDVFLDGFDGAAIMFVFLEGDKGRVFGFLCSVILLQSQGMILYLANRVQF